MEAFASLWSADLLALGDAVHLVEDLVDGFHVDVFDGHNVDELLFGPDVVAALRHHTAARIDVHLNVTDPRRWVDRFAEVGADIITVQSGPCSDVDEILEQIRARGCEPGLGVEVHESVDSAVAHFRLISRVLLLGTAIGVKGQDLDPSAPNRVAGLVRAREGSAHHPSIIVDGGIRKHTVPALAASGADGVVPGSLVFGDADPRRALTEIRALAPGAQTTPRSDFWTAPVPA